MKRIAKAIRGLFAKKKRRINITKDNYLQMFYRGVHEPGVYKIID